MILNHEYYLPRYTGGPAYDGIGGPAYAGIGGPCYSGIGGSGKNCTFRLNQLESFFLYRLEMSAPGDQSDVKSGLGQQPAVTSSNATCTHDRYSHNSPTIRACPCIASATRPPAARLCTRATAHCRCAPPALSGAPYPARSVSTLLAAPEINATLTSNLMSCLPIQGWLTAGDCNTGHYIKPRVSDLKFIASPLIFDI